MVISGDVNVHLGKDKIKEFCLRNSSNRNDEHLAKFAFLQFDV